MGRDPSNATAAPVENGGYVWKVGGTAAAFPTDDIPDSDVLDDFADGPSITSSEITDRQTFDNLSYQGKDPGERFNATGSRPVWTIDNGDPSVNDTEGLLEVRGASGDAITTESSLLEGVWEVLIESHSTTGPRFCIAETNNWVEVTANIFVLADGYSFEINPDLDRVRFQKQDENGNLTTLIEEDPYDFSAPTRAKVTRDSDGEWSLDVDGDLIGTATDTEFTEIEYFGIGTRRESGHNTDIREIEGYPYDEDE